MGECIIPLSLMYQVGGIGKYRPGCQVVRNVGCTGRVVVMEMSEDHPVNLIRRDPEYIQIGHNIGSVPVLTVVGQSPGEVGIRPHIRIRSATVEWIRTMSQR